MTTSAEMTTISMNSLSMNRPIFIEVYSVKYPATSSDSASGRSNGMRLFSAMLAVRKKTKATGCTKMPHAGSAPNNSPDCHFTIASRSSVP